MPDFLTDVNLEGYNTLAVPARARYFTSLDDERELATAVAFAREKGLPVLALGGGSNIVLRGDYPGLVIHLNWRGREVVNETREHVWLKVAAGENWHQLVEYCLQQEYWGLENLSLIPGSVGAAPIQNIGAYGVELKEVFAELEAMEIQSGQRVRFNRDQCGFGYRDSAFKNGLRDRYIITSVTLKLNRLPHLKLSYPALREALADKPIADLTPVDVSRAVCSIRQAKLPDPKEIPNVGSFFKNPVVDVKTFLRLQLDHPGLISYPVDALQVKLAAGWLIERAGWKGFVQGNVAVHDQQALVLINPGRGYGHEVLRLAQRIQDSIASEFGIRLEAEPRIYP
ncbi:UDP-N-acetylmuramate dehydrogenase [Marinimicrobium sp. ABcell2]|uniref:UDP-N-acetylmuramate dehydrogenase n=1 Tax=Marinimicrobium sp. ABcell2 TaxID=3069751 RepID=UPI0027B4777C|nr:UDP-N-acetylmuramate dehydrogenase [Marinimicrobium sp. ABcell2]MDQ2075611.1 UDP-N-acetylmuramate dehydrogenase [Marinimicrobium sp. ABcell2]